MNCHSSSNTIQTPLVKLLHTLDNVPSKDDCRAICDAIGIDEITDDLDTILSSLDRVIVDLRRTTTPLIIAELDDFQSALKRAESGIITTPDNQIFVTLLQAWSVLGTEDVLGQLDLHVRWRFYNIMCCPAERSLALLRDTIVEVWAPIGRRLLSNEASDADLSLLVATFRLVECALTCDSTLIDEQLAPLSDDVLCNVLMAAVYMCDTAATISAKQLLAQPIMQRTLAACVARLLNAAFACDNAVAVWFLVAAGDGRAIDEGGEALIRFLLGRDAVIPSNRFAGNGKWLACQERRVLGCVAMRGGSAHQSTNEAMLRVALEHDDLPLAGTLAMYNRAFDTSRVVAAWLARLDHLLEQMLKSELVRSHPRAMAHVVGHALDTATLRSGVDWLRRFGVLGSDQSFVRIALVFPRVANVCEAFANDWPPLQVMLASVKADGVVGTVASDHLLTECIRRAKCAMRYVSDGSIGVCGCTHVPSMPCDTSKRKHLLSLSEAVYLFCGMQVQSDVEQS